MEQIKFIAETYVEKIEEEKRWFFNSLKNELKDSGQILRFLKKFEKKSLVHYHHSEEVALLANRVAIKLGLTQEDNDKLTISAFIHDIGKVQISSEILHKEGRLTDDEFVEMMRHVEYGREIMIAAMIDSEIMGIALRHHEFKKIISRNYPRNSDHSNNNEEKGGREGIEQYNEIDQKNEKLARILAMVDSMQAAIDSRRKYNDGEINYQAAKESVKKELDLLPGDDYILDMIIEAMKNSKKYHNEDEAKSGLPSDYHLQYGGIKYFSTVN